MRIVGIGIAARDIMVQVDPLPGPDTKTRALGFAESGGGPVPTALVTMTRLGHECAFGGVVGDDDTARFILADLAREGIETSGVLRRPGLTSPVSVILVDGDGRRRILECNQAALPCPAGALESAMDQVDRCRALMLDARFPEAQIEAAQRARRAGAVVMLDCGHPRPGVEEILALADVALFSISYPRRLHGDDVDTAGFVRRLRASLAPEGLRVAGLTLGPDGSLVTGADGEPAHVPGLKIAAVDTTGAGDVFHGAFLHELLRGAPPVDAARFANAAAGLSCRGLTGRAPLPQEDEIRRAISY